MQLGRIVQIRTGMTAREAVRSNPVGRDLVLQAGDMPEGSVIDSAGLARADLDGQAERYRLDDGEVVLRGRGEIRAATYRGEPGKVVALSPLMVLRPTTDKVLPEYLVSFLRSRPVATLLERQMRGSSVRFVGKLEIETLDIPVPSLARQRALVEFESLIERERTLSVQLTDLRKDLFGAALAALSN